MKSALLNASRSRVECELFENCPARLVDARGYRVQCLHGIAWITISGQSHDVFLRAGQIYVVPDDGLMLAEAVGQCRIRIDNADPGRFQLPLRHAAHAWCQRLMRLLLSTALAFAQCMKGNRRNSVTITKT
jgi:hypothetical protein